MASALMFGEKPPVDTDVCRSRFMTSVRSGNQEEVQKRIDIGIDVNFRDLPSQQTPLLVAVARGDVDTVKTLLDAHADSTVHDVQQNNALHLSVGQDDVRLTELLVHAGVALEECDCRGDTPLLKASRHRRAHLHVGVLLRSGCRPDALSQDVFGRTPLHFAVAASCELSVADALLVRACVCVQSRTSDDRDIVPWRRPLSTCHTQYARACSRLLSWHVFG